MAARWMEFAQDLVQSSTGGLLMAYNADQVRQAIIRQLLTTPALTLDDGTSVQAEYIWDTTFGLGLRVLVGKGATQSWLSSLTQKINNCVLQTPGVNAAIPPVVTTTINAAAHIVYIVVSYTLANGTQSSLALQIAGT